MQNKKTYIVLAIVVVVIAAAAYIGGRLLNGQAGPLGLFQLGDSGGPRSMTVKMTPAPELPTTEPETRGNFVERQDNIIIVATFSLEAGGGGVASGPGGGRSATDDDSGPKVEVVVTSETVIYRDTTQFSPPSEASENQTIQQTVEEATLDDVGSDSIVTVWGRKQGDRIIAEVLFFFTPVSGGRDPQP